MKASLTSHLKICGKRPMRQKKQENAIRDLLSSHYQKAGSVCDYPSLGEYQDNKYHSLKDSGGTRGFIDFVVRVSDCLVCVEVDEQQHRRNDAAKEITRMAMLAAVLNQKSELPIRWIRFNPDAHHVDGKLVKVSRLARHARLIGEIELGLSGSPVTYLYYDH